MSTCSSRNDSSSRREDPIGKYVRLKNLRNTCKSDVKVLKSRAHSAIARWIYDAGIAFDAVMHSSFQEMINEIGKYGPGLKAPTFHDVSVALLKKEVEEVKKIMECHKEECKKYGCSIMLHGWKDKRERTLINFLVNCPKGSMFVKLINASNCSKSGEKIFELLSDFVEEIGPENVVQVVTDDVSNMELAGQLLMEKYPNLYWTPCAACCVDLIFKDLFKEKNIRSIFVKAMKLNNYIYSRPDVINLMRKFTKLELVKPMGTHFVMVFLILSRINMMKKGLRAMFLSDTWRSSKWAKEQRGIQASKIVLSIAFWQGAIKALKIASPLVSVLRLIDGDKKPPMGYIYEAMDRAKKDIAKSFGDDEEKYRQYVDIIDKRWKDQPLHAAGYYLNPAFFYSNLDLDKNKEIMHGFYKCIETLVRNPSIQNIICEELMSYKKEEGLFGLAMAKRQRTTRSPVDWWRSYGAGAPNLQKFAIKILSLTCSVSGCKRNSSFFNHVYSMKRNELAEVKLDDLMFVKYNRALRRQYNHYDTIDPIFLDDIDDSNKWLMGKNDRIGGTSDEEMLDNDLTLVGISRAEELKYITRERPSTSKAPSDDTGKGKVREGTSCTSGTHTLYLIDDEDENEEEEYEPIEGDCEDDDLAFNLSEDEDDI